METASLFCAVVVGDSTSTMSLLVVISPSRATLSFVGLVAAGDVPMPIHNVSRLSPCGSGNSGHHKKSTDTWVRPLTYSAGLQAWMGILTSQPHDIQNCLAKPGAWLVAWFVSFLIQPESMTPTHLHLFYINHQPTKTGPPQLRSRYTTWPRTTTFVKKRPFGCSSCDPT